MITQCGGKTDNVISRVPFYWRKCEVPYRAALHVRKWFVIVSEPSLIESFKPSPLSQHHWWVWCTCNHTPQWCHKVLEYTSPALQRWEVKPIDGGQQKQVLVPWPLHESFTDAHKAHWSSMLFHSRSQFCYNHLHCMPAPIHNTPHTEHQRELMDQAMNEITNME